MTQEETSSSVCIAISSFFKKKKNLACLHYANPNLIIELLIETLKYQLVFKPGLSDLQPSTGAIMVLTLLFH